MVIVEGQRGSGSSVPHVGTEHLAAIGVALPREPVNVERILAAAPKEGGGLEIDDFASQPEEAVGSFSPYLAKPEHIATRMVRLEGVISEIIAVVFPRVLAVELDTARRKGPAEKRRG